jgi:hypothetical protein
VDFDKKTEVLMKGDDELKAANEIRIVISSALAGMSNTHPKIFKDGRFANWTANVMMNIVIKLAQKFGEPKENVLGMVNEIWDGLKETNENGFLN